MVKTIKEEKDLKTRTCLVALNHHQKVKTDLDDQQEAEMNAIKKKYEALSQPILDSQYALIAGERAVDQDEIKDYKDVVGESATGEA